MIQAAVLPNFNALLTTDSVELRETVADEFVSRATSRHWVDEGMDAICDGEVARGVIVYE